MPRSARQSNSPKRNSIWVNSQRLRQTYSHSDRDAIRAYTNQQNSNVEPSWQHVVQQRFRQVRRSVHDFLFQQNDDGSSNEREVKKHPKKQTVRPKFEGQQIVGTSSGVRAVAFAHQPAGEYECEFEGCGFTGSYDDVKAHEAVCRRRPRHRRRSRLTTVLLCFCLIVFCFAVASVLLLPSKLQTKIKEAFGIEGEMESETTPSPAPNPPLSPPPAPSPPAPNPPLSPPPPAPSTPNPQNPTPSPPQTKEPSIGDSCTSNQDCPPSSYCSDGTSKICVICIQDVHCTGINQHCTSSNVCSGPKNLGGVCSANSHCKSSVCSNKLYFGSRRCVVCTADSHCAVGAHCTSSETCMPPVAVGEECELDSDCISTLCSDEKEKVRSISMKHPHYTLVSFSGGSDDIIFFFFFFLREICFNFDNILLSASNVKEIAIVLPGKDA
eukprot:g1294.t1